MNRNPINNSADRVNMIHEKWKELKIRDLFVYGFLHCDVSGYEKYTIPELVKQFCDVVPCFFTSYYHLHLLFTHRFRECDNLMVQLRSDLKCYPTAPVQVKIARIIHMYFINLPWMN